MQRLKRFWRHEDGGAAVEFALVVIPFLTMIWCLLQIAFFFLAQQILQSTAEYGGRQILVGNAPSSATAFRTAICAKIPALLSCSKVLIDVQTASSFASASTSSPTLTYDSSGNVNNTFQYVTGTSGSIVVVRLMYLWPMSAFFAFNPINASPSSRLLMATAVFKNE